LKTNKLFNNFQHAGAKPESSFAKAMRKAGVPEDDIKYIESLKDDHFAELQKRVNYTVVNKVLANQEDYF